MKYSLLFTLSLLIFIAASAQVNFNVFGGPQYTTVSYKIDGVKQDVTGKPGFQLGAGMKVAFEEKLFFAPSLFYSMKGYKVKFNRFRYPPDVTATDNNATFHTVETAFLLQYDFTNKPYGPYLQLGPSLDFQLFGKEKFNTVNGEVDRKIPFGYDKYGHFSANAILVVGYELQSKIFVRGQLTYGLASINNSDYGPDIKYRAVGISVGKSF